MRLIEISKIKVGMEVAKSIYTPRGQVLLKEGIKLTDYYIKRLRRFEIEEIYIKTNDSNKSEDLSIITEDTKNEVFDYLNDVTQKIKAGYEINYDEIVEIIDEILTGLLVREEIIIYLSDIRGYDKYTFHHSIATMIYSIIIALDFKYSKEQLYQLAVGALLHDIGKVQVDEKIIMKPGRLTSNEFKEIKRHSTYGYQILKASDRFSLLSANIAYQHHEKLDGSGYPQGLKDEEINEFAKIVTVADIYDALVSDRIYKEKLMPYQALDVLEGLKGDKVEAFYVDALFKHIAVYPIGTVVQLNNGETGVVIDVNKEDLSVPIIKVIRDEDGSKFEEVYQMNLNYHNNLRVDKVI